MRMGSALKVCWRLSMKTTEYGSTVSASEPERMFDYGAERAAAKADFEVLHANRAKYGAQVVIQRAVARGSNPSAGADIAQAHQGFARERMVKTASDDVAPRAVFAQSRGSAVFRDCVSARCLNQARRSAGR